MPALGDPSRDATDESLASLARELAKRAGPPLLDERLSSRATLRPCGALDLYGPVTAVECFALGDALQRAPWITLLRAQGAAIDALAAQGLAPWLARTPPRRALCLDDNPLGEGGAIAVLAALVRAPYPLEALSLARVGLGPLGFEALGALLATQAPAALALDENLVAPRVLRSLSEAALRDGAPSLRSLSLAGCARGPALVDALSGYFSLPRPSWRLELARSSLGDEGAARLFDALDAPGAPDELCLDDNALSAEGLAALVRAYRRSSRRLRALSLRGNALGDVALDALVPLVEASDTLLLDLRGTALSREGCAVLARATQPRPAVVTVLDHEPHEALRARAALRRPSEPERWAKRLVQRRLRPGFSEPAPPPVRHASLAELSEQDLAAAERVLRVLSLCSPHERERAEHATRVLAMATALARAQSCERRAAVLRQRRERADDDRALLASTLTARAHALDALATSSTAPRALAPAAPPEGREEHGPRVLHRARHCYVCAARFREVDARYHRLCPACAREHHEKRDACVDLRGRTALVTGARVRIGYQIALKLLRAGATLVATSRFAHTAAERFAREPDYEQFRGRLSLYALDLRFTRDVERFAAHLRETHAQLDVLVHNAAQTLARPAAYYAPLWQRERTLATLASPNAVATLGAPREPDDAGGSHGATLDRAGETQHEPLLYFPPESDDGQGQPLDLRAQNSWSLRLGEVSASELLSSHAVNALAPFVLTNALLPLLERDGGRAAGPRCVVFVSAEEGRFSRSSALGVHPHTNMAKAAVNMLVRTSADELARRGIYLTAVDTGWVSSQSPAPVQTAARRDGTTPPLDAIDGAARVCDPVFRAFRGEAPAHGVLLRNYRPSPW